MGFHNCHRHQVTIHLALAICLATTLSPAVLLPVQMSGRLPVSPGETSLFTAILNTEQHCATQSMALLEGVQSLQINASLSSAPLLSLWHWGNGSGGEASHSKNCGEGLRNLTSLTADDLCLAFWHAQWAILCPYPGRVHF